MDVFLGVDVGTGSARAGLFTRDGELLASAKQNIRMWKQGSDIVEQSSEDIWQAVCNSVAEALKQAKVAPNPSKALALMPPVRWLFSTKTAIHCPRALQEKRNEISSSGWITVPASKLNASTPQPIPF